jgi:hypothetical protein
MKVKVVFLRAGIWVSLAYWATLALQASDDPIVARYQAATCLPFLSLPVGRPFYHQWKTTLSLRNGSQVTVSGAHMPDGRIDVFYPATGQTFVATPGDYVYPNRVRVDAQKDLLYVEASGLAGGSLQRTYLFEYDLRRHRLLARRRVPDSVLFKYCPDPGP